VDLEVMQMQLWLELMLLTADLKYHQFYEAETTTLQILDILKANAIQKIILLIIFGKNP
jgi:hypothetical protein